MGSEKFMGVDIRVRVKGGGHVSQIYGVCVCPRVYVCACVQPVVVIDASSHTAIRQAISKSLVAYYQKCKWIHLRWRERKTITSSLPSRCGRSQQKGDSRHPDAVRPDPPGGRPQEMRAKEIWRTGCQGKIPEVLSLNSTTICRNSPHTELVGLYIYILILLSVRTCSK